MNQDRTATLDAFTRECLELEVDSSLSSRRVTRTLDRIIEQRGTPEVIRCDNGPELTSRHILGWCEEKKIDLVHISQKADAERSCRKLQWPIPR